MSDFIHQFPYSDFHEMNLDWIIKEVKRLGEKLDTFVDYNKIKFADPVEWSIARQYEALTLVFDVIWQEVAPGEEIAVRGYNLYMAIKPVPKGINIHNEEYWQLVIPFTIDTELDINSNNVVTNHAITTQLELLALRIATAREEIEAETTARENADTALNNRVTALETTTDEHGTDIETLDTRIDELFNSYEPGSTSSDAELHDIRTGYNNQVYSSAGDAVRAQVSDLHSDINTLIDTSYNKSTFVWSNIATPILETGWRTGYITNTGAATSSTKNIRSQIIPDTMLIGYQFAIITPPTGYFVWATAFNNNTIGAATFVAQYGDYSLRENNKSIIFPITPGTGVVICLGRFPDDDAEDYLTPTFINSITLELLTLKKVNQFDGMKFSILGDSISAYTGEIPEGNKVYYTGNNAGVSNPSQMWYNVLANDLNLTKLVINGWSGSCVTAGIRDDTIYLPASDEARCEHLDDGTNYPNLVFIAMGVNDYSYMSSVNKIGTWDGTTALGSESDMSDYDTSTFRAAYATMLARIKKTYPGALIVCITPWFVQRRTTDTGVTYLNQIGKQECDYSNIISEIANIMGAVCIDGTNIGFNRYNYYPTYCEDSESTPTHPNAAGQAYMGHAIATALINKYTN